MEGEAAPLLGADLNPPSTSGVPRLSREVDRMNRPRFDDEAVNKDPTKKQAPRPPGTTMSSIFGEKRTISDMLRGTPTGFFAPKMLLFGCILGICGFCFVIFIIILCEVQYSSGQFNEECINYHPLPATVSEVVYKWDSVVGRIFFGMIFLSGLSIYLSKYAFVLKNCASDAYVQVPAMWGCCDCLNRLFHELDLRWCDVRMFIPPVGIMLVCLIPTVPMKTSMKDMTALNSLMLGIHCCGAFMFMLGTFFCEWQFFAAHVETSWSAEPVLDDSVDVRTMRQSQLASEATSGAIEHSLGLGASATAGDPSSIRSQIAIGTMGSSQSSSASRDQDPDDANPDRIAYNMGTKELMWRITFNAGNIVFFLMFISLMGAYESNQCWELATFMRIAADEPQGCGHPNLNGCRDVIEETGCFDANLEFLAAMKTKIKRDQGSKNSDFIFPISEAPYPASDSRAAGQMSKQGCYIRVNSDKDELRVSFRWQNRDVEGVGHSIAAGAAAEEVEDSRIVAADALDSRIAAADSLAQLGSSNLTHHRDRAFNAYHIRHRPVHTRVIVGSQAEFERSQYYGFTSMMERTTPSGAEAPELQPYVLEQDNAHPMIGKPKKDTYRICICGLEALATQKYVPMEFWGSHTGMNSQLIPPDEAGKGLGNPPGTAPVTAADADAAAAKPVADLARTAAFGTVTPPVGMGTSKHGSRKVGIDQSFEAFYNQNQARKTQVLEIMSDALHSMNNWNGGRTPLCEFFAFGAFVSENCAGLCCIFLHLIIWYYADERISSGERANTSGHARKFAHRSAKMEKRLRAIEEELLRRAQESSSDEGEAPPT